jgi:hypothetical protein
MNHPSYDQWLASLDVETLDWFRMTPLERLRETGKLWQFYLEVGGSLDPEPDPQSPFYFDDPPGPTPIDGRPGVRVIRRGGV